MISKHCLTTFYLACRILNNCKYNEWCKEMSLVLTYQIDILLNIKAISVGKLADLSAHWVLQAPLCDSRSAHVGSSTRGTQAGFVHKTRNQKLWIRNMKGFWFLGVGGNQSTRRKQTKAGMESANQTHIQPLVSFIGERKVFEYLTSPPCHWSNWSSVLSWCRPK